MADQHSTQVKRNRNPPCTCQNCGNEYINKRRGNEGKKYCGRVCAYAARKARSIGRAQEEQRLSLIRNVLSKLKAIKRTKATEAESADRKLALAAVPCAVCGGPCGYLFGRPRTLCVQCAEQRAIEVRRLHHKHRRQRFGTSHRKRARHYGVEYEPVDKRIVFERDGWRCQICGKPTPRNKMGRMVSNAPELDHRIPVSKGGPHTYANTQCSCRQCNGAKGNSRETGQLPMFQHTHLGG